MTKELINYAEISTNQELISKAENLRKVIGEHLPEGVTSYKLMGIKTKKEVYPTTIKNVGIYTKPERVDKTTKSIEELTRGQIGFFGNLNNLKSLDGLEKVVNKFNIFEDGTVEGASSLIMLEITKDSLGRIVHNKTGVLFRPYTPEEEQEYLAKQEAIAAQELGFGENTDAILAKLDDTF